MKVSIILVVFAVCLINAEHTSKVPKKVAEIKTDVDSKKMNKKLVDESGQLWDKFVTKPTEQLKDWTKEAYQKMEQFNDKLYDAFVKKPAEKVKELMSKS